MTDAPSSHGARRSLRTIGLVIAALAVGGMATLLVLRATDADAPAAGPAAGLPARPDDGASAAVESTPSPSPKPASRVITGVVHVDAIPELGDVACGRGGDDLNFQTKVLSLNTIRCGDGIGGGYSDLHNGTQVLLKDRSGSILAAGSLAGGKLNPNGEFGLYFDFRLNDVPDASIYQVEVSDRGAVAVTRQQMVHDQWSVGLTIG